MKKLMMMVVGLLLVTSLLASCGQTQENDKQTKSQGTVKDSQKETSSNNGETNQSNAKEKESGEEGTGSPLWDKIKEKGVLVLGTSADYPPYEFHKQIDGKDQIVGFEMEVGKEIAKALGVELEIKDMNFDGLLPALEANKIDVVIAGMTSTEERKKSVDFSIDYYAPRQTMIIRQADEQTLKASEDFIGKTIGAQKGTIQEEMAKKEFAKSKLIALAKNPALVMGLKNKKMDGVILVEPVAKAYADANDDLVMSGIDLGDEGGVAVALAKGNQPFVDKLNEIIEQLVEEGKIDQFVVEANELQNQE